MCRNKALDELHRRGRYESWDDSKAEPCCHVEAPALELESRNLYDCLRRLVLCLPAGQREVIDLWTEGFSNREIARITGGSEGNVRVLVHRALKRLRGHPMVRQLVGMFDGYKS